VKGQTIWVKPSFDMTTRNVRKFRNTTCSCPSSVCYANSRTGRNDVVSSLLHPRNRFSDKRMHRSLHASLFRFVCKWLILSTGDVVVCQPIKVAQKNPNRFVNWILQESNVFGSCQFILILWAIARNQRRNRATWTMGRFLLTVAAFLVLVAAGEWLYCQE